VIFEKIILRDILFFKDRHICIYSYMHICIHLCHNDKKIYIFRHMEKNTLKIGCAVVSFAVGESTLLPCIKGVMGATSRCVPCMCGILHGYPEELCEDLAG